MRDLLSNVAMEKAIAAATISTNTASSSAILDLKKYNSACFIISSHAYTDGTYTLTVEEGDESDLTDSAAATVANGSLHPDSVLAVSAANKRAFVGYKGDKQYVRVTLTSTSTSSGALVGVDLLEGNPKDAPVVH